VEPAATQSPSVAGRQVVRSLPRTGSDSTLPLTQVGVLLIFAGVVLSRPAQQLRKRTTDS
jgi:LPXTG-motif cell wall-anchored protein